MRTATRRPRRRAASPTRSALRARRVRALFLCGLQERAFPAPARPEPFLGDDERRAINAASGLRLRAHEDVLGAERYLLYAAVVAARASGCLLSWHAADDDGDPAVRSLFVDDVADLFSDAPLERRRRARPGRRGWAGARGADASASAARPQAARRAAGAPSRSPLRSATPRCSPSCSEPPGVVGLGARGVGVCPVKWFVERLLQPEELEPDPEPMVRGDARPRGARGGARPRSCEGGRPDARRGCREARERMHAALWTTSRSEFPMSRRPERRRAALRRLEADLLRYVEAAAHAGSRVRAAALRAATSTELDRRATGDCACAAASTASTSRGAGGRRGDRLRLQGQDRDARRPSGWTRASSSSRSTCWPRARLLDLEPGRRPLPAARAPRTAPARRAARGRRPGPAPRGDGPPDAPEAFDALLDAAVAGGRARGARGCARARSSRGPTACAWGGGCAYPTICRCEA